MKSYQDKIATNPAVELIFLSQDDDDGDTLNWAKKEKFPWPTIMQGDVSRFFLKHFDGAVPTFVLIDRKGKKLTSGKEAIFDKLDSLGADT